MLLRTSLCVLLLCNLAAAADGPWARFFNQPAMTAKQGERHALSTAVSSAFNPLNLKTATPKEPLFPQESLPVLLVPQMLAMALIPCSVPLIPYEPLGNFFITQIKPGTRAIDPGMLRAFPSAPCK